MSGTLEEVAPDVTGEQPVPESTDIVQPEEVEVQEPEPGVEEVAPADERAENANEEDPAPEPETKPEPEANAEEEAKEEPATEEQPVKRKLEEDEAAEPEAKKMNTGPGPMEMEVCLALLLPGH